MTTTPIHTYKTVEGTEPTTHGKHEARTVEHTVTTGSEQKLFMMTEIGDGVFVQWTECTRCNKQVVDCGCPEGPQEPKYMKPWRDKRFARSLNTRPNPSYQLLDSVIEWVKERGYTVEKSVEKQLAEAEPYDPDAVAIPDLTEDEKDGLMDALGELRPPHLPEHSHGRPIEDVQLPDDEGVDPEKVDAGLDEALARVREAKQRDLSEFPDDF